MSDQAEILKKQPASKYSTGIGLLGGYVDQKNWSSHHNLMSCHQNQLMVMFCFFFLAHVEFFMKLNWLLFKI
jgi:hypothetical protein